MTTTDSSCNNSNSNKTRQDGRIDGITATAKRFAVILSILSILFRFCCCCCCCRCGCSCRRIPATSLQRHGRPARTTNPGVERPPEHTIHGPWARCPSCLLCCCLLVPEDATGGQTVPTAPSRASTTRSAASCAGISSRAARSSTSTDDSKIDSTAASVCASVQPASTRHR